MAAIGEEAVQGRVDFSEAAIAPYEKLKPGPGKGAADVACHQRRRIDRAMVKAVAEQGYDAVTVRELARVARVSTRTFYRHYQSKEECFLRVQWLIARRVLRGIPIASQGEAVKFEVALDALLREWSSDLNATRLTLIAAYSAGPRAIKQAHRVSKSLEYRLGESLGHLSDDALPLSFLLKGIVAGLSSVVCGRLLAEQEPLSKDLREELMGWARAHRDRFVELESLRPTLVRGTSTASQPTSPADQMNDTPFVDDRVGLFLLSAAKLATSEGYETLHPSKVAAAAGLSQKGFDAHFSGLDECLLTALERSVVDAMGDARQLADTGATAEGGIYRAAIGVCARIANDPLFARLCLDDFAVSAAGKMRRQEQLARGIADYLGARLKTVNRVWVEASLGAFRGVLQGGVGSQRTRQVHEMAPLLAYMLLAAIVGPAITVNAIRREQEFTIDS